MIHRTTFQTIAKDNFELHAGVSINAVPELYLSAVFLSLVHHSVQSLFLARGK